MNYPNDHDFPNCTATVAFVNRGVARWKLGKVRDARRDFEEALRLDPGNREAVANLHQLGAR